jgi:GNAT superfamily N-acetyltransferase
MITIEDQGWRQVSLLENGESVLTTKTGRTVTTRTLECGDASLLVDLFNRLSERTRRLRFSKPRSTEDLVWREAERISDCESQTGTALVGVVREDGEDRVVALVQVVGVAATIAEVAAVVRDDYQNEGVGKAICQLAVEMAMERGVRTLQILTQAENKVVLWMVRSLSVPYSAEVHYGDVAMLVHLPV